ncbi:MAG: stage II sporulation protein M, partial [Limisphaerales bacterium]
MILDLHKFIETERPYWAELETILNRLENEPNLKLSMEQLQRFHYLYERTSADLGKLVTFASEPQTRHYLEALVARAYGEIHETRTKGHRLKPVQWFFHTFPQTFRRQIRAFWLSLIITMVGVIFGGFAIAFDPDSKSVIMPFPHLLGDPAERVAMEERAQRDRLDGAKSTFSAQLMTHNTKVSIFAMSLGMTWG